MSLASDPSSSSSVLSSASPSGGHPLGLELIHRAHSLLARQQHRDTHVAVQPEHVLGGKVRVP